MVALVALVGPATATGDPARVPSRDAGAEAAERGWWGVARREWRADVARGDAAGATADDKRRAASAAARLARLDALECGIAEGAAARAASAAPRFAAEWSTAWRTPAAVLPPAAGIAVTSGLVLWNSGRAVHGVSLADGRPPWPVAADARDTTIFPRGLAAAGRAAAVAASSAATVAAPPPCVVGGRAYAVVVLADGGERLVCVDLSSAAEGRLVWAVAAADLATAVERAERRGGRALPAGTAATGGVSFDGQPVADPELCLAVIRAVPDRGGLFLAAFSSLDGRLAWVRPAGRARTATGDDLARGRRRPCLAEDRIALVTHAGAVIAFDRDGTPAWTTTTPAAATATTPAAEAVADPRGAAWPPAADAVIAADRIVAAPRDATGVVALDPWSGAVVWHWSRSGETVAEVIGAAGDGVLVATADADGTSRLRRLAIRDGGEQADRVGHRGEDRRRGDAGRATLVGSTVFWPRLVRPDLPPPPAPETAADSSTREEAVIEVLDAGTLERRRDPLRLTAGAAGPVALAGQADRTGSQTDRTGSQADRTAGPGVIAVVCAVGAELVCLRPDAPAAVPP